MKTCDIGPNRIDTGPNWIDTSPNWIDTGPNWIDTSPNWIDTSPNWIDTSPTWIDTSPTWIDTSPTWIDTSPNWIDTGPNRIDAASNWIDAGPDRIDATSNWIDTGPGRIDTASNRTPLDRPETFSPHGLIPNVGKSAIRTFQVPRWVTIIILVIVSIVMAALIVFLSGRAYLRQQLTLTDVISLVHRYDRGALSSDALLATMAPEIADILFFMPWGALAFLSFDGGEQHRLRTYLLTLAVGLTFALGLVAWQSALPTRVTGWEDAGWNMLGCLAGAVFGHLRKRVRVRFE